MNDAMGVLASAMVVAICGAILHSIIDLRRRQAKAWGVPYWDRARIIVVATLAALGVTYFGLLAVVVALG